MLNFKASSLILFVLFTYQASWGAKDSRPIAKYSKFTPISKRPYFDIPVTYNKQVRYWLAYFQGRGRKSFQIWLDRSNRYLPKMKTVLKNRGLPTDLAYVAMIESGFSAHAVSSAAAVGYWQFISATGRRYGLKEAWWIDERRDFYRSTRAAANYLSDLYKMFDSWYLTAAAYNMGENRLKRLIKRYKTKNFWKLSRKSRFPKETKHYIPKLISAVLISKHPKLYGFKINKTHKPYKYEPFYVPGGTHLTHLARSIGNSPSYLKALNPALIYGLVPKKVNGYWIRIPKGKLARVAKYIRSQKSITK